MRCSMCYSSEGKLKIDNVTFNRIKCVLPDFSIPESENPAFICATCLKQVSSFCTIKMTSLQNCCRLKYFKEVLAEANNLKFEELKIIISNDEVSAQHQHHIEFKINSESKHTLSSENQEPIHIKEEVIENDDCSQQLVNDEPRLNHLQDKGTSSASQKSSQNQKNLGSYEFVDMSKLQHIEFKIDLHSKCLFSSEEPEIYIKKENQIYNYSDTASLNYLHDEGPSCSSNNAQKHENLCVDKFIEQGSNLASNNSRHEDQPKTRRKNQEKRFKCTECHKAFADRSDLKRHTRVHTGEKPYQCTICQKTFTQLHHLNAHKLIHTGEKPHECDVCHKTFNYKSNLKSHKQIHNNVRPYQCAVCSRGFIKSEHLTKHMLTHTGEKPHRCHLCEYKCAAAGNLKVHIRFHTGEKPYSCKHCDKSFTTTGDLKKHKRRLHSNEDSD